MNKTQAKAEVRAWFEARHGGRYKVRAIRHIHTRSYVVGHAAPQCLIVAECWADSEPHLREIDKNNPLRIVHAFDKSLKAGMWCCTAYVATDSCSEVVAIPLQFTEARKA